MADRVDRLIADAARCLACGKEHQCREIPDRGGLMTWADPSDGHAYRRPTIDIDWLRAWRAQDSGVQA